MVRLAQAVFKGGGIKGVGLVGALAVAEEQGWRWRGVAGTSAGAITAALVAAGYTAPEVRQILMELDFRKFRSGGPFKAVNLLLHDGLYKGDYVVELMDRLLEEKLSKKQVTFRDLPISCQIVATDLTHRRMLAFPYDLSGPPYNQADPLSFPVSWAVRASIAIPFFFEPYRMELPGGLKATLVDGGLLSNFPVHLFSPHERLALLPTFGLQLTSSRDDRPQPTESPLELAGAMVNTILGARDQADLENQDYVRTIRIESGPYHTTQFDIDEAGKEWLYHAGRQGAEAFFAAPAIQQWLNHFPLRFARAMRSAPFRYG